MAEAAARNQAVAVTGAAGFHPSRRYVFWVEPRSRYGALIAFLRESGLRNYRLFLPGARPMMLLQAQALEQGLDLERTVLPYSTVHAEIDEELYAASEAYARWFTAQFFRLQPAPPGVLDPAVLTRAVEVMLTDRLAALLRPALTFAHTLSRMARTSLVFVPKAGSELGLQLAALDDGVRARAAIFDVENRYRGKAEAVAAAPGYDLFEAIHRRHPVFEPAAVTTALAGARIAFVSNLADKQYRLVCEQVVGELCADGRVGLLNASLGEGVAEVPVPVLDELRARGRLAICSQTQGGVFFPADAILKTVERCIALLRAKPPRVALPAGIDDPVELVARAAAQHFAPILETATHQHAAFAPVLDRLDAVVVSPGRYLPATLMVEMAKRRGIPTIELQGGVIARSRRFFPPSAETVLCTDRVSRDIYTDFLGVAGSRVRIVGSARIDQSVAPALAMSVAEARAALGVATEPGQPLVAIATQPIGVERAQRLLDLALAGLAAAGLTTCVIKPHPNESSLYLDAYAKVAARHPGIAATILVEAEAHVLLRGVDVLVTYFSTMGIEAFVLGKGVISVNPFGEPPPFDLCALGVATPAASSNEVRLALTRMRGPEGAQFYATDPDLALLRDGGARRRIADAVRSAIAGRRGAAA